MKLGNGIKISKGSVLFLVSTFIGSILCGFLFVEIFHGIPHLEEQDARIFLEQGHAFFKTHDVENAQYAYKKALQKDPHIQWAHYQLGRIYFVQGKFAKAEQELFQEISTNPHNKRTFYLLGLVHAFQEDFLLAEQDFRKFVLAYPKSEAGHNDLAQVLFAQGKLRAAEKILVSLHSRYPESFLAHQGLGAVYLELAETARAVPHLQQALRVALSMDVDIFSAYYPSLDPQYAKDGIQTIQDGLRYNLELALSAELTVSSQKEAVSKNFAPYFQSSRQSTQKVVFLAASCEAGIEHFPGECCDSAEGNDCNLNSCGDFGGQIQCDGTCSGPTPPERTFPGGITYGDACFSSPNNCSLTNPGNIDCAGLCDALVIPDDNLDPSSPITSPGAGSWQTELNFPLSVSDFDPGVCGLDMCYYSVVDSIAGPTVPLGTTRSCNANTPITVGGSVNCITEGINTCTVDVYAEDLAGNVGATVNRSFSIDRTAPSVTIFKINGLPKPWRITTNSPFTVTWGDHDLWTDGLTTLSGINHRELWKTTDAGGFPWEPGWVQVAADATSGDTDFPDEDIWWYGIRVIDNAGNCITEAGTHCPGGVTLDGLDVRADYGPIQVIMDKTPPNTLLDPPPPPPTNPTNIPSATFGFKSTEPSSTFECALGPPFVFGPCTFPSTMEYPFLSQGTYEFQVRATDLAGNTDASPALYNWLVDLTAPTVLTFEVDGKDLSQSGFLTSNPSVQITWTAADNNINGSGINREELWRAIDIGGSPGTWRVIDPNAFSGITDAPGSGTWWYGIHVVDNATNCITEKREHCGGVTSDIDDLFRIPVGPIQVIVNGPPVVFAGVDKSITGNNSRAVTSTFDATVMDDGLPDPPAKVETKWTLDSGPAAVVITDDKAVVTAITFTKVGPYKLILTANDDAAITTDDIIITLRNLAPVVDAGPDQTVEFAHLPVDLRGIVTDDGFPNPPADFTVRWTKISGPGAADLINPTSVNATVSFTHAGTHVLRLTADDTDLAAFDEVIITYEGPDPGPLGGTGYSLVPCGVIIDNPDTRWDDTKDCELKHTLLLIKTLIDFTLWKLIPLILVLLTIATGVIFYFSFGGVGTLANVRLIWSMVLKGVLILLFSWLFLNFLLGILGFDINIFGRWYDIEF